ncbi:16S rRNA (guanine(966)-N(2))-methyltransferase RsmD [Aquisalimonas sp.]|uniref:16S rRNA (guanine(966)-N(2))-methyltransferase RsmD n=1 Tax=unclassified Aquisalimonas TaxID=2644645 RepID=UPI0025BE054E|nr:16S rRNA (guanine(966)-N(2))-methyltransferase RsmD [Aquisalimonas sp.]
MAKRARNELRIIGGEWRGRRLRFAGGAGLRPTADRNRETLFNWLQPVLPGSRCLDVFAGSGALGFEAASRGAAEVVLVERDRRALAALRENVRLLAADDRVSVHGGDALSLLSGGTARPFDIIFLDPPFREALLQPACQALATGNWSHADTRIYMEHARQQAPALPPHWQVLRERTAGDVRFVLLQANGN